MNNNLFRLTAALTVLLALSACDSITSTETPTYDADSYTYKGAADPLLAVSGAERAGPLGDRFDLIQGRK